MLKKNKLRYNEYYDMQHIYDELYAQSKNGMSLRHQKQTQAWTLIL